MYSLSLEQILSAFPKGTIAFSSGPATIIEPNHIEYLKIAKRGNGKFVTINYENNKFLHLIGDFYDFRFYILVTYDRFEIVPNSVKIADDFSFLAKIRFFLSNSQEIKEYEIKFKSPIYPLTEISLSVTSFSECWNDGFEFKSGERSECFVCDLTFLTLYAENLPNSIRLNIEYIGIAKAKNREAEDRLGVHEKLQKLLSQSQNKPNKKCAIVLYRFKDEELSSKVENFSTTIEVIEASTIKYFQPQMNEQRKNFPKDSKTLLKKLNKMQITRIVTLLSEPKNCILRTNKIQNSNIYENYKNDLIKYYFEQAYKSERILFEPKHYINIAL